MEKPMMFESYQAAADIDVVPAYFPIPGFGILPINTFLLKAAQPVLVDCGLVPLREEFMEELASLLNPEDLRWLWLTHADQDHVGSVRRLLEMAPSLRIITTYLAAGRMSLFDPLPMDRIYLLNPGQSINVGDRVLTAIKPPVYDAAETMGFYDPKAAALFSSDCFGALMSEPAQSADGIETKSLQEGMVTWATVDAPWLHIVDRVRFAESLHRVRELSPKLILSAHLPAARDMTEELLETLGTVPTATAFVGPDQQALEIMMRGMTQK